MLSLHRRSWGQQWGPLDRGIRNKSIKKQIVKMECRWYPSENPIPQNSRNTVRVVLSRLQNDSVTSQVRSVTRQSRITSNHIASTSSCHYWNYRRRSRTRVSKKSQRIRTGLAPAIFRRSRRRWPERSGLLSYRDQLCAPSACRKHLKPAIIPFNRVPLDGNPSEQLHDQTREPTGFCIGR